MLSPSYIRLEQLNATQWHCVDPDDQRYVTGVYGWCEALAIALNRACLVGAGVEMATLNADRVVLMLAKVSA